MNFKHYLNERTSKKLIICDIQPEYEVFFDFKAHNFCKWLNIEKFDEILTLYVGVENSGMTDDSMNDVKMFYIENGLSEDRLHTMSFIEKGYGFLRNWMDNNISSKLILEVLTFMKKNNYESSKDIPQDLFIDKWPRLKYEYDEPIYFPDIDFSFLKKFSRSTIVGGGKNECLAEIKILFDFFKIKTTDYPKFVY